MPVFCKGNYNILALAQRPEAGESKNHKKNGWKKYPQAFKQIGKKFQDH